MNAQWDGAGTAGLCDGVAGWVIGFAQGRGAFAACGRAVRSVRGAKTLAQGGGALLLSGGEMVYCS